MSDWSAQTGRAKTCQVGRVSGWGVRDERCRGYRASPAAKRGRASCTQLWGKSRSTRAVKRRRRSSSRKCPTDVQSDGGVPRRLLGTSARLGQRALVAVVRFRGQRSSRRRADDRGSAAGRADDLGKCDGVRSSGAGVARQPARTEGFQTEPSDPRAQVAAFVEKSSSVSNRKAVPGRPCLVQPDQARPSF
jgi:hypothetical protein